GMDFKHLDITGINLYAEEGSIVRDTIFGDIKMLSATDRSGFTLKNLKAHTRVAVNGIRLENLDITTANSHITNYLSFEYSHFRDFLDFLNRVKIDANLSRSEVSLKDLNYFVRTLDKV